MCIETKAWIPLLFVLCLPLSWAASAIGSVYRWITLLVFFFCIVKNKAKIRIAKTSMPIFLAMSFMVGFSVFSMIWGTSISEGIKGALSFILMYLVAIVFVSFDYGKSRLSERLDQFWIAVGIISACLFIFGDRAKIGLYGSRTSLRILGTSTDPNEFAGLFAVPLAVNVYYAFTAKGRKRIINILAMAVEMFVVLLSGSRGAMIACIISMTLTILFCIQMSIKNILILSIVVLLLAVVFARYVLPLVPADILVRMKLQTILNDGGGGRSTIWESALEQYWNGNVFRILFGYGANGLIAVGERGATGTMHNYYLQVLTNFGLVGLGIYLNLFWKAVRRFWICNRKYVPGLIAMAALSLTLTTTPNYKPIWILLMTAMIPQSNLAEMEKDDLE